MAVDHVIDQLVLAVEGLGPDTASVNADEKLVGCMLLRMARQIALSLEELVALTTLMFCLGPGNIAEAAQC